MQREAREQALRTEEDASAAYFMELYVLSDKEAEEGEHFRQSAIGRRWTAAEQQRMIDKVRVIGCDNIGTGSSGFPSGFVVHPALLGVGSLIIEE